MSRAHCQIHVSSVFPFMRRLLLAGFAALAAGVGPLAAAGAPEPWEAGPFVADPAAVIEAASRIGASAEDPVIVLFSETRLRFEEDGRVTRVKRVLYRIQQAEVDASWSALERSWAPWYQERPELRARVITPDGAVHSLDPATVAESGAAPEPDLFEDGRILRAPLPATGPGAVVEQEVTVRDTAPFFDAGTVETVWMRGMVPVHHAILAVDAPAGLPLRHVVRHLPEGGFHEETVGGRRRLSFEYRDLPPYGEIEPQQPLDLWASYVELSTGASWADVAGRYAEIVEEAARGAGSAPEVQAFLRSAGVPAASRRETIDRLLARLGSEVRYTGVELGAGAIIPRPPAETLRRKFGDCKDKAVLLTVLLRALDIPAQVALLLASEDGLDIEESLPGMGGFNHAIVVVPGTPEIWIDPTNRYARAGELPAGDQGRLALIASPKSGGLVRTPEATAADNREVVTRELVLADLGPARAVETNESRGEGERAVRAFYATQDEETLRESLLAYLRSSFQTDKLEKFDHSDPADLASPFHWRLEAAETQWGQTDRESAVVSVFPGAALSSLPDEISEGEEDAEPKPRQSEYLLAQPILLEVHHRAVPPAGFRPKPLPQGRVRRFGPATLSEDYTAAADGTVAATLRFEIDKRRLTAEEFNALREGVREVNGEGAVLLEFEQVGEAHLAAGRVREALDELRRLADLSPQKALPRTRLARALLAGGMGEEAREEARRAIALEPSFAIAHRDLAWILQHDEVGRRFGEGFDRAGALAAYRKAKELDPEDMIARADLAILLAHDEKGRRYAKGSDLAAAIDEYRELRTALDERSMDANLLFALFQARRFAEMKELLAELEPGEHSILRLVAAAVTEGSEAAIREAERRFPDVEERRNGLLEASQLLVQVRRYEDAAALVAQAARQAPNAAEILSRVEMLRKLRRHEELTFSLDKPADVAKQWLLAMASEPLDRAKIEALFSRDFVQELGSDEARRLFEGDAEARRGADQGEISSDVILDLLSTLHQTTVTGDDAVGYRVALTTQFDGDRDEVFLVREDGVFKIAGLDDPVESLGLEALRRLQRDDLRGARQWLDWAREEVRNVGGDDPLASSPFAALWTQGTEATADEARCAAASLLVSGDKSEKAVPLLLSCRDSAPDGARRTALDLALALAYRSLDRHADLAEEARRLAAAFPRSQRAYLLREGALASLARWDELRRLAEERLAVTADDPLPWLSLYGIANRRGDLEESERVLRRIVDNGKAGPFVFNNLAWLALVRGRVDDQAIEHGQRAAALGKYEDPDHLHTLAALYAEQGRTAEAYQLILQVLAARSTPRPEPHDWFVFGLLAEHYGLPEAARRYYARVTPPGPGETESTSTYRLAQQRLAATESQAALPARANLKAE